MLAQGPLLLLPRMLLPGGFWRVAVAVAVAVAVYTTAHPYNPYNIWYEGGLPDLATSIFRPLKIPSPASALPPPAWPILTSPHPLPWEVVPTEPPDCPCFTAATPRGGGGGRDASEGKGPQRRPQRRLDRRLEEVAEAVGGGYCRLQMPLKLALAVRGTVAGHWLGALEGPLPMHPLGGRGGRNARPVS